MLTQTCTLSPGSKAVNLPAQHPVKDMCLGSNVTSFPPAHRLLLLLLSDSVVRLVIGHRVGCSKPILWLCRHQNFKH